mgnify:CR=1 FL=1
MPCQLIKNKFISTIIGTIAVYVGIAYIIPIGNFSVYITSFLHLKQDFVTMHYGMFINLIFHFAATLSHPLGGIIENKIGFLFTIYTGYIILFIGNLVFIFQQNLWLCGVLCIVMGIGEGIAYSLLMKNLTFYAPKKKGIISGAMAILITLAISIFSLTGEKIIAFNGYTLKDKEEFYPEHIAERTYLYFIIGIFSIPISMILSTIFLYEYKPEIASKKYIDKTNENENNNENNNEINDSNDDSSNENSEDSNNSRSKSDIRFRFAANYLEQKEVKEKAKKNVKIALKSLRFWRITLFSFCLNFPLKFINTTGRTIGALIGLNGKALQYLQVFQASSVVVGGPLLGILVDKKGPLLILRIVSIILFIPGILLIFFMDNLYVFIGCLMLVELALVGLSVGFHTFIMEIFGIQESVILAGVINLFSKISEIITTVTAFIVSFFYTKAELEIPYKFIYIICTCLCFISIILIIIENKEKYNYNNEKSESDNDSGEEKDNENKIMPENSTNHSFESDENDE